MSILYIALMIGGLILVHELGHFLVARGLGVHVVEFSIGFGPRLWSFKGKQANPKLPPTEYQIALLPVGGYVRMLGADPGEEIDPEVRGVALNYKPVWRRLLIALAGPAFNLILPFILFFLVGLSIGEAPPSIVGDVSYGAPAWEAGIRPGDRITEVDGEPVALFSELADEVEEHPDEPVEIAWDHLGQERRAVVTPRATDVEVIPEVLSMTRGRIGVSLAHAGPIIGVQEGSLAAAAGLSSWDLVVTVDGEPERYLHRVLARIAENPGREIALGVLRYDRRSTSNLALGMAAPHRVTLPPASAGDPSRGIFSAECLVHAVIPGSPADRAGLARGDRILDLDGRECTSWVFAQHYLGQRRADGVTLQVARGERVLSLSVKAAEVLWPADLQPQRRVTIYGLQPLVAWRSPEPVAIDDGFGYAVDYMMAESGDAMLKTLAVLGGLLSTKVGIEEGLGGPALIAQLTTRAAERGWEQFLRLMAMLSVSLGLINLLPIPILDGGTILFLAIEGVRRKPVSMRVRMIATYAGLAFVVLLMVIVTRNDLQRCSLGMIGL